jgi:Putative bacterial sensory transduction regulator
MAASSGDRDGSREQSGSQNTPSNRRTRSLPPTVPIPVTTTRLRDWFRDRDYTYFVDNDGDLGGLWKGRVFFFLLLGPHQEILQIRGHWNRDFAIERLPELLDLCNTWHVERIWPTAYTRVRDDGMVNVTCEVTGDVTEGATDAQLSLLLQCGLETASVFFDELDDTYPDPAALAP